MLARHGLTVTIDVGGLRRNFQTFRDLSPNAEVAAVVKADAYGCGLKGIVPALWDMGCRTFFVAHLDEGIVLRKQIKSGAIYVLNGLLPGSEPGYSRHNLRPVITAQRQLYDWCHFCRQHRWYGGAALHLDTGINRMGFRLDEVAGLGDLSARDLACFDLVLSHLSCSDEPQNPRNADQIARFAWARSILSRIPRASLASSAGCFLGPGAHFEMVRPGIGLFGGNPFSDRSHPFHPVATASAPLLQVKLHRAGDFIGYGSGCRLERDTLIGAISVGYADGLPRTASSTALAFHFQGASVNLLGRISMDMTLVDMTTASHLMPQIGDAVEIFGPRFDLNAFAKCIGTIPNEVLTSFGKRAARLYLDQSLAVAQESEAA